MVQKILVKWGDVDMMWRQAGSNEGMRWLVVLFHDDFPVKHSPSLPQHVEEELRKQWDVGQHDNDEAVVVVK